jgi:hypothetical protein
MNVDIEDKKNGYQGSLFVGVSFRDKNGILL